tara:strand:- start:13682 stop:14110 length:429 start_codon:yes stop_codon:yes gene_type:complete
MRKPFKASVKKFLSLTLISFSAISFANLEMSFEGKTAKLNLIISNTDAARRKGLMNQSFLEKNTGMLFIWPSSNKQCMWMKNTSLPLSVAYLSSDGRILEIYDMVPFSEDSICSMKNVRMAVEVNQGWFAKNKISLGDKINL